MVWAATAVAAASAIYSGVNSYQAGKKSQKLQEEQGALQRDEAIQEALRIKDDGYRFKQEQMMQYIGSGVEISGTPLLLLRETEIQSEAEAAATVKRGYAQERLATAQGKVAASTGRAQLIGSLGSAVSSSVSTYSAAKGK